MFVTKKMKLQRNILSGVVVVIVYSVQVVNIGLEVEFDFNAVVKILIIAFLSGLLFYIGLTFIYWVIFQLRAIKNQNNRTDSVRSNASATELCKVCDEVTLELHGLIANSLPMPKFDSELVDDMSDEISNSWLTPCFAFCYALVSICMLKRDINFLKSDTNERLQNHVMRKMADIANQSNIVYGEEEKINQELAEEVSRDMKTVIRGISFYFKQIKAKGEQPFARLIDFLSGKVHTKLQQELPELHSIANKLLIKIDAKVERLNNADYR